MAYCTITDVQALLPNWIISATSKPTTTQVEAIIIQIAAEIDAVLEAKGFTVPFSAPLNFVESLKATNAYGTAALVGMGMFDGVLEAGGTTSWKEHLKTYKERLELLRKGEFPFDVIAEGGNVGSYYHVMESPDDFPDPAFRKRPEDKDF